MLLVLRIAYTRYKPSSSPPIWLYKRRFVSYVRIYDFSILMDRERLALLFYTAGFTQGTTLRIFVAWNPFEIK